MRIIGTGDDVRYVHRQRLVHVGAVLFFVVSRRVSVAIGVEIM